MARSVTLGGIYETEVALYSSLYSQLKAPDWAGHNLDALFDVLTTETEGPIELVWTGWDLVEDRYMSHNQRIGQTLLDAAAERDDLSVSLRAAKNT